MGNNRTRRNLLAGVACLMLLACGSEVAPPESGVGFGNYDQYLEERERAAQARESQISAGMVVSSESSASADITFQSPQPVVDTLAIENANAQAAESDVVPDEPEIEIAQAQPAVPADPNNPSISDEQNFDAVSARESIDSDRERLEKQREQFQVIEPTALPKRRGSNAPNIVVYALSTTNALGESIYPRGPFKNKAATERNCGKFLFEDLAQEAFLAAGGPERDPKRLDPDGDGFACGWDPTPFRVVRN